MTEPVPGQRFEINSLADGLVLQGRYWAPAKPIGVMSLVHGLGEHSGRYTELAEAMGEAGVAVVALDLRGHGNSAGKRGVCTDYKLLHGDMETLLGKSRGLYPELPHFLYGHSLGGGLVLDYGRTPAPDIKGIIASAPFISLPNPTPAIIGHIANLVRRFFPAATLAQPLTGDKISTLPEEQKIYENDPLNHSRISFGLAVDAIRAGERVAAHASQWDTPLLLMHAKGDQLTSCEASEAFAKTAQNVTFRCYENSEHEMHHDTPKTKVFGEMIDFIKSKA